MSLRTTRTRISHRGFRPGSPAHALVRKSVLHERATSAHAIIRGALTPEDRRRAQRRMAAAKRELRKIAARREYRDKLSERDRNLFDALTLKEQDWLRNTLRTYSENTRAFSAAGSGRRNDH